LPHLARPALLGALIGALGFCLSLAPFTREVEEDLGLGLLFALRGPLPAPGDAVVVSADKIASDALGLPADVTKWPRAVHIRLIEALTRAGAAVIVFDLFFAEARGVDEDAGLSAAIRQAGNVILVSYLARDHSPSVGTTGGRRDHVLVERVVPPLSALTESATATAPFPLPKVPVRLSQYWTFKHEAGDVPTLPVVALHLFAREAWADLVALVAEANPALASPAASAGSVDVPRAIEGLRQAFQRDPTLARRLSTSPALNPNGQDPERHRRLRALVRLHGSGSSSEYLNFYGPPKTVATVSYHDVVQPRSDVGISTFKGRAVFVGRSDHLRFESKDGFHTVFSLPSGADVNGVEIAATAFLNLLEARPVVPATFAVQAVVLLGGGLALGALVRLLPPLLALVSVLALGSVYLALAYQQFAGYERWLPLVVPILVQLPLALVTGLGWRYLEAARDRRAIQRAFAYHLPDAVVERLARDVRAIQSDAQLVHGICLATDAERYTTLAESMDPAALSQFMNRYYAAVFEPVRRHGGFVSDVLGDAVLAIWPAARADSAILARACSAACEINAAVDRFNRASNGPRLPTRLGLHCGEMMLGHVGAGDHYEYRAVGDIVNTTTRIQALNKPLGTWLLASEAVVATLDEFVSRRLGTFLLAGKARPVVIYELVVARAAATPRQLEQCRRFADALAAYDARTWKEAAHAFAAPELAEDGPSRFYHRLCEQRLGARSPDDWDGVIRVEAKWSA
jgi:adenylate cyclase